MLWALPEPRLILRKCSAVRVLHPCVPRRAELTPRGRSLGRTWVLSPTGGLCWRSTAKQEQQCVADHAWSLRLAGEESPCCSTESSPEMFTGL